jgi:hypothetical protein
MSAVRKLPDHVPAARVKPVPRTGEPVRSCAGIATSPLWSVPTGIGSRAGSARVSPAGAPTSTGATVSGRTFGRSSVEKMNI